MSGHLLHAFVIFIVLKIFFCYPQVWTGEAVVHRELLHRVHHRELPGGRLRVVRVLHVHLKEKVYPEDMRHHHPSRLY